MQPAVIYRFSKFHGSRMHTGVEAQIGGHKI